MSRFALLFVAPCAAFLSASPAAAQLPTFQVNTTADTVDVLPGDGVCADAAGNCSLRAAVQECNAGNGGRIVLGAGLTYTLALAGAGEDAAASGDLDVLRPITILAHDATIDAALLDRAFDVAAAGELELRDARIAGGAVTGESGGGVRSAGSLTLTRCTIDGCTASGPGASGGGVFNQNGELVVFASTLTGCSATRAGGAIEALGGSTLVEFSDMTANDCGPSPGNGGAFHLTGTGSVNLRFCNLSGNVAASEGGGAWNSSTGSMSVVHCTVVDNDADGTAADNGGGGLFNDGGTLVAAFSWIVGNRATMGSGSGGGLFNNGGELDVLRCVVRDNEANRAGGGVEALAGTTDLSNSTFIGNFAGTTPGNGGGFHLTGAGMVSASECRFSDNAASAEGGGMWNSATGTMDVFRCVFDANVAGGNAADQGGGGLFNDGGTLSVLRSTITDNSAPGTSGSGGGILNVGGNLTVARTRVAYNDASRAGGGIEANLGTTSLSRVQLLANTTGAAPGNGGGLHLTGAGSVTIDLSSVTLNHADNEGGGLWNSSTGTMIVTATTILDNTSPTGPDVFNTGGTFTIDGVPVP